MCVVESWHPFMEQKTWIGAVEPRKIVWLLSQFKAPKVVFLFANRLRSNWSVELDLLQHLKYLRHGVLSELLYVGFPSNIVVRVIIYLCIPRSIFYIGCSHFILRTV